MTSLHNPDEIIEADVVKLTVPNTELDLARHSTEAVGTALDLPSVGDYVLIAEVGEGGFGKVYKAKHKNIDKIVALKIIHSELVSDSTAMKRFEQEAVAASNLTHVNLASVYDHGRTKSGAPFLVMDFLEGENLANLLEKDGPIPCEQALEIMIELCVAMDHAHKKGIMHRDLKPSNIMICNKDGVESVKIIDFGIAKLLTVARSDANRITQTAQVLGSPAYMAPEQCLGETVDARSDIYSLGCLMYEMLVGRPPFVGANPVQTVVQQINDNPATFAKDGSATLKRLEWVILKALNKRPAERYQTMTELTADLRRVRSKRNPKHPQPSYIVPVSFAILFLAFFSVWQIVAPQTDPTQVYPVVAPPLPSEPSQLSPMPLGSFQIKNVDNKVLYSCYAHSFREALAEAISKKVNLRKANLSHVHLNPLDKERAFVFTGVDLDKADFTGADLTDVTFAHCNLSGATFRGNHLNFTWQSGGISTLFDSCDLKLAQFAGSECIDRVITNTDLSSTRFEGDELNRTVFAGCNLSDAVISTSDISGTVFKDTILDHTKIISSQLGGTHFRTTSMNAVEIQGGSSYGMSFPPSLAPNAVFITDVKGYKDSPRPNRDELMPAKSGSLISKLRHFKKM